MDHTRFRRPATQTQRQNTTKTAFGNPQSVPKAIQSRPRNLDMRRPAVRPRPVISTPSAQTRPAAEIPARKPTLAALAMANAVKTEPSKSAPAMKSQPLSMELPGEDSPTRISNVINATKWRRMRRLASRSTAVAIVLIMTVGGLLFSQSYFNMNKVFKGGAETAAALQSNVKPELLKGEGRGRINVLLLGRGGGAHDAPDLTDTMLLASIDPVNRTATLLSLPRDLWVNVPDQGVMKINAAWQSGEFDYLNGIKPGSTDPKAIKAGFATVNSTVEEVLGLTVDYNMLLDFQAFKQAVDTVGGINVNVPADLVDPTMAWENGRNPVLAKAGIQTFNGKQSLNYVRSRETSSDYARGERQRAVLVALKSKTVSLGTLSNPLKLSGLINSFGNNVYTDLSAKNAARLYSIIKSIDDNKITSIGLADEKNPLVTGSNINGQSVVLPKAGLFKYTDIQQFVRSQLKDPYIMKEKAKVMVLNGTLTPGLATAKAEELKSYGYNVTSVGNTPSQGWTSTTLVDLTRKKKYTKNYLEQRLNVKASPLTDNTIATNGADFVIIIGSDGTNTAIN